MSVIHPITVLTPELETANIKSRYARSSSELSDFRLAIENKDVQTDESVLSDFRRLVPTSGYESYRLYVDKFNSRPCKLSEVEDLLAPGLPIYIPLSSATTNKKSKQFVKYFRSQPYAHGPPPVRAKTTAFLFTFAYRDPVEVVADSGEIVKRIPQCNQSSGVMRLQNNWTIETDDTRMASILPGHVAPWATGFIIHHRSFLLIHALFALANATLEGFAVTFMPYFMDMVHRVKEEWDVLVSGIRYGEVPDFEQIGHVRAYLEANMHADPQRADELHNIGPPLSRPGWAQRVWPNLKLVKGICSGTFAAVLPQVKSVLGPNVIVHNTWYICTECLIGRSLNFEDTETFVIAANDLIEYFDMADERTPGKILQAWDLQPGKLYQPVSTSHDGLWRYLIDDVIRVTGFDPRNGLPVFRFSRRKNLELRLPHAMITEADLVSVIHAISGEDIMEVQEFTTTVGFFIGIAGDIGPNAKSARQKAFAALAATSEEHQIAFDADELGLPTIRIVKPGTFTEYRRWRGESMKFGVGQIKVPVVLSDCSAQKWMEERVMMEL
ncbi:GH3 auxin-responsive promoter [Pisolithus albus]|nr:GH3 auxin-responsive promoter [Pisolithus albus]